MGRNSILPPPQQPIAKPQQPKYQPSYRLGPKIPYNREKCELILKQLIDKAMIEFEYTSEEALALCERLSEDIKSRVKLLKFDRYRIICTVTIGERYMQSFESIMKFLWDPEKDGFATYVYDNPNFYVIGSIFAVYLE